MAFLDKDEVHKAYVAACDEADIWRKNYPEYERLMDNGLMDALDENLPEVNDGSLAASLFKMAKRVIRKKMGGSPISRDRDDKWINDIADIQWNDYILKNAKSEGTPRQKWKHIARSSAGYGGQPVVTIFTDHGADFIAPYAQDVKLEAGKKSDLHSDVLFWDVYFTELQWRNMIEQAEEENKEAKLELEQYKARKEEAKLTGADFDEDEPEPYNKWDVAGMKEILENGAKSARPGNQEHSEKQDKGVETDGIHCYIAVQRGVNAPFYMKHTKTKKCIREWSNPDPTGDVPIHYLYYYQDFVNPYGVGIVKLAGGTQNVLDYMRQADILATQIGLRPPRLIEGNADDVDEDSMVYAQDANWYVGNARVTRQEITNGVYNQLPGRIGMYKTSLDQMVPSGDTTISGESSGDPQYSKVPAGIEFRQQMQSIDDEDFTENIDECYAAVAASMINTHFANMQGSDLMKLDSDQMEILAKAGIEFPMDEEGNPSLELELAWDEARSTFDFEVDPEADKTRDEEAALEGKLRAYELVKEDPEIDMHLMQSGKKIDRGELLSDIFSQLTDNDKIIKDVSPEDMQSMEQEQMAQQEAMMAEEQAMQQPMPQEQPQEPQLDEAQEDINIQAIAEQYEVPMNIAAAMREAEILGEPEESIMQLKDALLAQEVQNAP